MQTGIIILLVIVFLAALVGLFFMLFSPGGVGSAAMRDNMRNIVSAQRQSQTSSLRTEQNVKRNERLEEALKEGSVGNKGTGSKLTLQKRLKFAQWRIPVIAFHAMELAISCIAVVLAARNLNILWVIFASVSGPIFMRWLLTLFMERRFKAFDRDYPQFLLSLVGLLKTGMNPMSGLESAAQGLEDNSLVRQEVEMMLERLRFGVSEDRSIGCFGEEIFHPEIELFVQALLLSRRVGGTLSDTLERLAKQVRRRQYFRSSANAAVGMQRGSIWFIICVLVSLEIYLYFIYPEAITGALKDPAGQQVWQFGIAAIVMGIFWVRQVTKIKV